MTQNPRWGATVNCGPGTKTVLPNDELLAFAHRALDAGAGIAIMEIPGGYLADVAGRRTQRRVRVTGPDLADAMREALERFEAGATDTEVQWRADRDGIAHGHAGRTWTLCQRTAVGERFRHPETSRCRPCLRALDTRVAA